MGYPAWQQSVSPPSRVGMTGSGHRRCHTGAPSGARSRLSRDCREPLVYRFCRDAAQAEGLSFILGEGQWNIPGSGRSIPKRRTVEAYEVEHEFPSIGRRVMLLNARRVFDEDGSASAILLAIEDVTRRREADYERTELLQAKEILLQEMQHRVANSLQIIASILLLKARTVQSEETRLHLQMLTSVSCRWRRCSSSCTLPG